MKIHLANLKDGLNELFYIHSNESLRLAELEDAERIFADPIEIRTNITKVGTQFFVHVFIDTIAYFSCDRCLEDFKRKIHEEFRLVYSTGEAGSRESEYDFRLLKSSTQDIDITPDIRETLLLLIPMKVLCSDDCQGLCPECGINLNHESCDHGEVKIAPHWEALRNIQLQ